MKEEKNKFEDAENSVSYYDNEKLNFKDIVLQHLKKIGIFASVEFRGGYWEERAMPINGMITSSKIYVQDTREVYCNAVEYLIDILYSYFDKEMNEIFLKANELIEELRNKYMNIQIRNIGNKTIEDKSFININDRAIFRDEKVMIMRELFREICSFLARKKYLELGTMED